MITVRFSSKLSEASDLSDFTSKSQAVRKSSTTFTRDSFCCRNRIFREVHSLFAPHLQGVVSLKTSRIPRRIPHVPSSKFLYTQQVPTFDILQLEEMKVFHLHWINIHNIQQKLQHPENRDRSCFVSKARKRGFEETTFMLPFHDKSDIVLFQHP